MYYHHNGDLAPYQIPYNILLHLFSLWSVCNHIPYTIPLLCQVPAYMPLHYIQYFRDQICFVHMLTAIHHIIQLIAIFTESPKCIQLPFMSPRGTKWCRIHMANVSTSIESIWVLLFQVTPIPTGHSCHLVEDKTKNNDRIKSQVRKESPDLDNAHGDEHYRDPFYPVGKDSRGWKDICNILLTTM